MTLWLGFFVALAALLVISQKNLGIAMFVGALILGVSSIPDRLLNVVWATLLSPSSILLVVIVGLIPIIGGTLEASGQMDNLVNNMRVGRKAFLMLSPALVGLLPMPGGALISAPLVEKGGGEIPNVKKAGINVWFRHILYLVYPTTADLIVSTEVAQLSVYEPLPFLFPLLLFSMVLGYIFFLKDSVKKMDYIEKFSLIGLLLPLIAILIAPILDVLIKLLFTLKVEEFATFVGVSTSLLVSLAISKMKPRRFGKIVLDAKPWNYGFMMIGILFFLDVFKSSGILQLMANVNITAGIIFLIAFLLGFGTGRIITPAGIIFPIYIAKFGMIPLPTFALLYFSIFLGYVITPVHPCVSLSVESFKIGIKDYFKVIMQPTFIAFIISFFILFFISL